MPYNVLNDEFVAGLIGLVPAYLLRSHSLQYANAWFAVAMLSVDTIRYGVRTRKLTGPVSLVYSA